MRSAYAAMRARHGVARLAFNGQEALFSTPTPFEVRCLDRMWFTEKRMLTAALAKLKPGDVFLDVGSHRGIYAILAAKKVGPRGTVIAFEPQQSACDRIAEHVRLNGLENIQLCKMALSDRKATRKLVIPWDEGGISGDARLCDGVESEIEGETIETAEYDWLVKNRRLPIPQVVKIDIEGHEFSALKGMRATLAHPSCVALFCEIHPARLPSSVSPEQVIAFIQSLGFGGTCRENRASEVHLMAEKIA